MVYILFFYFIKYKIFILELKSKEEIEAAFQLNTCIQLRKKYISLLDEEWISKQANLPNVKFFLKKNTILKINNLQFS